MSWNFSSKHMPFIIFLNCPILEFFPPPPPPFLGQLRHLSPFPACQRGLCRWWVVYRTVWSLSPVSEDFTPPFRSLVSPWHQGGEGKRRHFIRGIPETRCLDFTRDRLNRAAGNARGCDPVTPSRGSDCLELRGNYPSPLAPSFEPLVRHCSVWDSVTRETGVLQKVLQGE